MLLLLLFTQAIDLLNDVVVVILYYSGGFITASVITTPATTHVTHEFVCCNIRVIVVFSMNYFEFLGASFSFPLIHASSSIKKNINPLKLVQVGC